MSQSIAERAAELFQEQEQSIVRHTDLIFARLMVCQWLFCIGLALVVTPRSWAGTQSQIHWHVWTAALLGGLVTIVPVLLAKLRPGQVDTRHAISVGQMLMSALLIHVTGGRLETHFHVFGSLAMLSFYRDEKVLLSASGVVYLDHLMRGILWPESVYGVLTAPLWRSFEHAGWVIFEVSFLWISIRKSRREMLLVAERQAYLEFLKADIERTVEERTYDLTREVAERRLTEERLKKSQAQLAQAQLIARLGSWEWELPSGQVTWSAEAADLYGGRLSEGKHLTDASWEHVHPDDRASVQEKMRDAVATAEPVVCDHRTILLDGTERVMQLRGQVVVDPAGHPRKILGTVQDVTEARRAEQALRCSEEQLRQSQKMEAVGRLAGGVAHDFNNLLTVIGGYCAMSLQRVGGDHPVQRYLAEIQKAAERASSLTGQLLAFSRKQVLQPRVLRLNEVVRGMEKMLRRLIGEDVELATHFEPGLGAVRADPGQLEQVVMNLAVNARDAMPRGGKLTISTANCTVDQTTIFRNRTLPAGDYVLLAVSDNGIGMTEETKSHLFEPFFTTKGLGKGTGLGLATCYGIICQSDGDIRVYTEPNCGTTFKIYLPRTDATSDGPTISLQQEPPAGNESILVVEDDASVRMLAVTVLRENGYQVQESHNGFEALESIRRNPEFDLVLTDVVMPQMSGKALRDQILDQLPRTKVLLMSGYTDDALAHHGVLEEGLAFLEKPFSPLRLARKVREVLDAN